MEREMADNDPQICGLGEKWSAVPFLEMKKAGKDLGKGTGKSHDKYGFGSNEFEICGTIQLECVR